MRSIVNRVIVLVVIGALTSVVALAKTIKKDVIFTQPVTVDGTVVKKGTYKVTFDEETGELLIKKGNKVVAKAQGRLENTDDRFTTYTRSDPKDSAKLAELISVSLKTGTQVTVVNGGISSRQ